VAISPSTVQSVLKKGQAPITIVQKITPTVKQNETALLNVNWRRPYVKFQEFPSELYKIVEGSPDSKLKFYNLLKASFPNNVPTESGLSGTTESTSLMLNKFHFIGNFAHGMDGYKNEENYKTKEPSNQTHSTYWTAVIPKSARVFDAGLQIESFGGGEGKHMQIHLSLDTPILLLPQSSSSTTPETLQNNPLGVNNWNQYLDRSKTQWPEDAYDLPTDRPVLIRGELVYALMPAGFQEREPEPSIFNGISGNIIVSLILGSTSHMALDQLPRGSYIREYKLNMTDLGRQKIWDYITSTSRNDIPRINAAGTAYRLPVIYNIIFYNCISEALIALNVGYMNNSHPNIKELNIYQFNPFVVTEYLLSKNVISEKYSVELNSLKNYSGIAKAKKEYIMPIMAQYQSIVKSDTVDEALRRFAYQSNIRDWQPSEISLFIKLASKDPKKILYVDLDVLVAKELALLDQSSDPSVKIAPPMKARVLEIAKFMDNLLSDIKKSAAGEIWKKEVSEPMGRVKRKIVEFFAKVHM